MKPALPALLLLLLTGCNAAKATSVPHACQGNYECDDNQLCFAEGCGDPGKGLVVEVDASNQGIFARDFSMDGTLNATQDFSVGPALSLNGQFLRTVSPLNPLEKSSYTASVMVRAAGKSSLLPGVSRSYEAHFATPERGFFEMKVGAGSYTVTATAAERTVPPAFLTALIEPTAAEPSLTFTFPAIDGAPALSGQLIRFFDTRLAPPEPQLVSTPFAQRMIDVPSVELQLVDPETDQPLSQRFPIANTTGEFALIVSPEARTRTSLVLVAAPVEPGAPVPTKRFTLTTPLPSTLALEFGDFGDFAEVSGVVVDKSGAPVVGAQVVLEGVVGGDGTFRSKIVETSAQGEFKVTSLPSKTDAGFRVTVVPPRESRAAATQQNVTVKIVDGVGTLRPARFELKDRLVTRGVVVQPVRAGAVVSPVTVRATLQADPGNLSLPLEPAETVTALDGSFELPLDTGKWRFEYVPSDPQPMASRLITVQPTRDANGNELPTLTLPEVQISSGRTVSGVVTGSTATKLDMPLPYSRLRFFRVTSVEGKPTSVLLGTSIADDRGRYSVVLPTVPATTP